MCVCGGWGGIICRTGWVRLLQEDAVRDHIMWEPKQPDAETIALCELVRDIRLEAQAASVMMVVEKEFQPLAGKTQQDEVDCDNKQYECSSPPTPGHSCNSRAAIIDCVEILAMS